MEMDGSNSKGHYPLKEHIRLVALLLVMMESCFGLAQPLCFFFMSLKIEIPRAFVCAESKIFDVSEWAICQVCSLLSHCER